MMQGNRSTVLHKVKTLQRTGNTQLKKMKELDKKEGNERRYPLTPQAEANLKEVLPHLDEKLGSDIEDCVSGLRDDLQSDVTVILAHFTTALSAVPDNNHVKNAIWQFFLRIKEQMVDFGPKDTV